MILLQLGLYNLEKVNDLERQTDIYNHRLASLLQNIYMNWETRKLLFFLSLKLVFKKF